jgi:DnaJ-class molecular chaperone
LSAPCLARCPGRIRAAVKPENTSSLRSCEGLGRRSCRDRASGLVRAIAAIASRKDGKGHLPCSRRVAPRCRGSVFVTEFHAKILWLYRIAARRTCAVLNFTKGIF